MRPSAQTIQPIFTKFTLLTQFLLRIPNLAFLLSYHLPFLPDRHFLSLNYRKKSLKIKKKSLKNSIASTNAPIEKITAPRDSALTTTTCPTSSLGTKSLTKRFSSIFHGHVTFGRFFDQNPTFHHFHQIHPLDSGFDWDSESALIFLL